MPSTYSNLKIQLMATGENNTTWGDVTNLNLGTALEEAIVGSADVPFSSADVTLTLTDTNASQTARNMRLNLTGTATSGYNLIVPAIEKPYIINNATDGTITVKNATGTGIAVPAGKTMWVYNNGTNVVDAVTRLSSLTLGTDLAVADGGTGASTFTSNGVLLGNGTSAISATAAGTTGQVLVGNTGSAPTWATLSTSAVTSFSAGTTGLTPNSATTGAITLAGTLNVANGGTGATSLTSGYLVKGNGTSAVSASVVYDDGTNVGIGTNSPAFALDVATANARIRVAPSTTTNYALFQATNAGSTAYIGLDNSAGGLTAAYALNIYQNGAYPITLSTSGTERMRIDSSGNLGIGTSSPSSKFVVSNGGAAGFEINPIGSASAPALYSYNRNTNAYDILTTLASEVRWQTGSSPSERMRINSSGNVGIGVTNPNARLSVSRGSAGVITNFTDGVAQSLQVSSGSGYIGFLNPNFGAITFRNGSDSAEFMRLDSSGNVGIGTSSPSGFGSNITTLDIEGSSGSGIKLGTGSPTFGIYYNGGNAYLQTLNSSPILFATNNAERARIDSSGNLLLNTTSTIGGAGDTLHIAGKTVASTDYCSIYTGTSSTVYAARYYHTSSVVGSITFTSAGTLYNTSSDYRLKDIDGPLQNSGAYIDALKPVQGSWKADGSRFIGLIAHEVQEVSETQIATGVKDGEEMQAMDYSAPELIANLIAEIQSLRARVAQLEGN